MNTMPRPFLTSGTAMAAVVGALLLGAEDLGRSLPFARGAAEGVEAAFSFTPARAVPVAHVPQGASRGGARTADAR